MQHFFTELISTIVQNKAVVLSTIVNVCGTTPRSAGSFMAVLPDRQFGTVGGGTVELTATADARLVLQSGQPMIKEYSLDGHGTVSILHRIVSTSDLPQLQALLCKLRQRQAGTCILSVQTLSVVDAELPLGFHDATFYLPLQYGGIVYVFGAGHVAQATVPLLQSVDFHVVVYDNRPALCQSPVFAAADRVICAPFTELSRQVDITEHDYVVLMTSGLDMDKVILPQVFQTPACYIGLLGSQRKISLLETQLDGHSLLSQPRFHAPIGIEIGGETPAEVAVSVVAQLIQERAKR